MKQQEGHDPGYVDYCDHGILARSISGKSHPRDECYSQPVYVAHANGKNALSCVDHFRSVTQMMLERAANKEVVVRRYEETDD